jgi:hypothetical protein
MTDQQFNALQKSLMNIQVLLLAGFSVLAGQGIADSEERKTGRPLDYNSYLGMLDKDGMEIILGRLADSRKEIEECFANSTPAHSDQPDPK